MGAGMCWGVSGGQKESYGWVRWRGGGKEGVAATYTLALRCDHVRLQI